MPEEYCVLQKLNHQNVMRLCGTVESCRKDLIGLVFEYLPNGALANLPRTTLFDCEQSLGLTNDLLSGVHYLHQSGVIHRDINPNNLLLTKTGRLKITDFSVSIHCNGKHDIMLTGTIGTPAYLAPECVCESGKPYYGKPVDVWATGMAIYWIWTKETYFNRPDKFQIYRAICEETVHIGSKAIPPEVAQLLRRMFQKDPVNRSPISDLVKK
ncbi:hypothetical protein FGIG_06634 [Fasciola gigantica]|uniref:Protein kinase domain-containing protein n=1 Tax=Fasciola gigantica TaxID=46835 RepID=A0A504YLC5_FASGI|nr:hypothetical protein FGIG_06634 [Fasciola gigantica]